MTVGRDPAFGARERRRRSAHGEVSRDTLARDCGRSRDADEVPIGHITNGVHLATWMARDVVELLDAHLGHDWVRGSTSPDCGTACSRSTTRSSGRSHLDMKTAPMRLVREEARRRWADHWKEAAHVVGAGPFSTHGRCTIGFARRFATYKRADLIFRDVERLRRAAHEPAASGADHLRRARRIRRQPGQGNPAERLPVHPRAPIRGSRRVHRGLRFAPRPSCWCRASICG